jgi:prepilin-type N-terminal cleavage/methylation domain-containing protein
MKNKKGFTLIEILISAAIMSILVVLIMSVFITSLKNFKTLKNKSELQFQTQYIINFVSDKVMKSKNVALIKSDTSSVINSEKEFNISKISLKYGNEINNYYIFEVHSNKIYYGNSCWDDSADVELGVYVSELKAAPYPAGRTFADTHALKFTLCLEKEGHIYETEQLVYMRNNIKMVK